MDFKWKKLLWVVTTLPDVWLNNILKKTLSRLKTINILLKDKNTFRCQVIYNWIYTKHIFVKIISLTFIARTINDITQAILAFLWAVMLTIQSICSITACYLIIYNYLSAWNLIDNVIPIVCIIILVILWNTYFCCKIHLNIRNHNYYHNVHWLNYKIPYVNNFDCNYIYNLCHTFHFCNLW